jgi:hypothetical protein
MDRKQVSRRMTVGSESQRLVRFCRMDPKTELLGRLSAALSRGQGGFTKEELALAFEEVYNLLIQGQLGSLIIDGELDLMIKEGTVFYSAAKDGQVPLTEAVPLETLIKNVRSAEGQ